MRIASVIVKLVFILSLPALFISAGLAWGFNSLWLYEYGFQKYDVSQSTGLPEAELEKAARGLIGYFNSTEEYVHITVTNQTGNTFELFTPDEQVHFRDVRGLVWLDYRVLLASLIVVLIYTLFSIFRKRGLYHRQLAGAVIWGSRLTLILLVVLGIAAVLDFDRLFLQFHFLAFTNTLWSAQGYMLLLFPGGFWFDAALICGAFIAGLALVFNILSRVYLRAGRKTNSGILPEA